MTETERSGSPAFVVPSRVLHRGVAGQMVLLHMDSEQYFGLDEVGARILKTITELPLDDALQHLLGEFDVDPERLRGDLHNLVDELLEAGLLERVEGSP